MHMNPMQYMNADGLKPGGSITRIKQVQDALNRNFGATLTVNGIWDTATEAALQKAGYNTRQLSETNIAEILSGDVSNYMTIPKTAQELKEKVAQHEMVNDYNTNRETLDQKYGSTNLADFIAKAAKDYTVKTPGTEGYTQTLPPPTYKKKTPATEEKSFMAKYKVPLIIGGCLVAALAITGSIYLSRRKGKAKQPVPTVKYTITK